MALYLGRHVRMLMIILMSVYLLVCKVEVDKKIVEHNYWFENYDGCYEWENTLVKT